MVCFSIPYINPIPSTSLTELSTERADAGPQVNNVSGAVYRGYTAAQGGHAQAVIDYKDRLARQEKARTSKMEGVAVHGTAPSSRLPHTTHNNKRSQALQPIEDVHMSKRPKWEPSFPSSQRHISYGPCLTRETPPISVSQDSGECVVDHGSAEEKSELETSQPEVPPTSEPPHECTNGVNPHDSDAENEVPTKSLHTNLSQSMSSMSPDSELKLCEEQTKLVGTVMLGGNVFYTGSAGCGKSTVLKRLVRCLQGCGKNVDVIAPTARAALNVNGRTLHSYAGWTPNTDRKPMEELLRDFFQRQTRNRLTRTHVLVIDEISTIENFCLERLDKVMKAVRDNKAPFGGVQVIVSGDFCQLPPVKPMENCLECGAELELVAGDKKRCVDHGDFLLSDQWAFRSDAWRECNFTHDNLTTMHRQKDSKFINILEKLRVGKPLSYDEKDTLKNHESQTEGAVKLFPLREAVKETNDREFNRLRTPINSYLCHDDFRQRPEHDDLGYLANGDGDGTLVALKQHQFETTVKLRERMRVILLVNLSQGLVNGSQGIIIGFEPASTNKEFFKTAGEHGDEKRRQLDAFMGRNKNAPWPIVEFSDGRKQTIYPHCMINEYGKSHPWSLLSRTQVPLMAAWAMTIHKAQGMTLDQVVVDLADTFEKGHAYVALSRASSLAGLKVENLGRFDICPDRKVIEFLEENLGTF